MIMDESEQEKFRNDIADTLREQVLEYLNNRKSINDGYGYKYETGKYVLRIEKLIEDYVKAVVTEARIDERKNALYKLSISADALFSAYEQLADLEADLKISSKIVTLPQPNDTMIIKKGL